VLEWGRGRGGSRVAAGQGWFYNGGGVGADLEWEQDRSGSRMGAVPGRF